MNRYRLLLEWDGRPFMGWQRQAHGPSVQGAIEAAAARFLGNDVAAVAAGRTDTGVHAVAMSAHLDATREMEPFRVMEALNAQLRPLPIAVLEASLAEDDWHARFSCIGRAYRYRIVNRRAPLTLQLGRAWQVATPLDAEAMNEAAQLLIGRHDFTTFRSAHCQSASPVKTLDRLVVWREGDWINIEASARSFLHHQVRSMVGCLVLVGRGRWSADDLAAARDEADRAALGLNAPPDGLYFTRARY